MSLLLESEFYLKKLGSSWPYTKYMIVSTTTVFVKGTVSYGSYESAIKSLARNVCIKGIKSV